MITPLDIKKMIDAFRPIFATKKDLEGFAIKDDLRSVAKKQDLEGFATKQDIKGLATKQDLEGFAMKKDLGSFATKEDLESDFELLRYDMKKFVTKDFLEEKLVDFRSDIFNKVDAVYGELKTEREEQTIHAHRHDEIEENIEKLNKEVFPATYSHRVAK